MQYDQHTPADTERDVVASRSSLGDENNSFGIQHSGLPTFHANAWWVRLSAQVYLTLEDFEAAGQALKVVCEKARDGEWKA